MKMKTGLLSDLNPLKQNKLLNKQKHSFYSLLDLHNVNIYNTLKMANETYVCMK